jgi:hypothetical protein
MRISIRPARIEDARNTAQALFNSVHGTGAQFYPKAICEEWSPPLTEKRVKEFEDAIFSTTEIMFVAEVDGQIAGFASIVPKTASFAQSMLTRSMIAKGLANSFWIKSRLKRGLAEYESL